MLSNNNDIIPFVGSVTVKWSVRLLNYEVVFFDVRHEQGRKVLKNYVSY